MNTVYYAAAACIALSACATYSLDEELGKHQRETRPNWRSTSPAQGTPTPPASTPPASPQRPQMPPPLTDKPNPKI